MACISIITVNYKQDELTLELLRSLKEIKGDLPVEVILVDNAAKEDHGAFFRKIIPDLKYIKSARNLGFAGGNNLGIEAATGDYLFFINNDTELTANLMEPLYRVLRDRPEVGLVSPLILYFEDKTCIQYAGYSPMNYYTGRNSGRAYLETDKGQFDEVSEETGYCHGAAMMCRKSDLLKVGKMDERYFLYYEELDWCEHFKKAGFKTWFCGEAKIYHKESMSVGKESLLKTYFMARNRLLFIRRHTSWWTALCFTLFFVGIASTKQALIYLSKGRFNLIKWHYKGLWWHLKYRINSTELGFNIADQ